MKRLRIVQPQIAEDQDGWSPAYSMHLDDPFELRTRMMHELEHKRAALSRFMSAQVGWPGPQHLEQLAISMNPKADMPKDKETLWMYFQVISAKLSVGKQRKNWSNMEVGLLFSLLIRLLWLRSIDILSITKADWDELGTIYPGRTGEKCMFKWLTFRKFDLAKYHWTQE